MEKLIISEELITAAIPVTLISLRGAIETTNAAPLEEVIDRIVDGGCHRIVVDLSNVSYISSAGWGIFMGQIRRVRRENGDIKLAAMRPEVQEVFDLLEFDNILQPYPGRDEAIRDFQIVEPTPRRDKVGAGHRAPDHDTTTK